MSKNNKKTLEKKNWRSQFTLTGKAKVNDYTYRINEKSEKSDWIYNMLNLGVDCGTTCGTVYAEMMGGYGSERDNVLYVHGKNDEGQDDYENRFTVDWDDRFEETILETIGDTCFIKVGIEKDKKGKLFINKFLSPYDAIEYIKENLENETVVNVKGNIEYSVYNDNVQVRKRITSIFLSNIGDVNKYTANFTQTLLLKKDSIGKLDKEKGTIPIYATVLEYFKTWKNKEVKQIIPLNKTFEHKINMEDEIGTKKLISNFLKVKKGVNEITFEGIFIETGALITMTVDDLPDDIQELIEIGVYTKEEALTKCTENTGKEKRMVLLKPSIKMITEGDDKIPVVAKIEQRYTEDDLILPCMLEEEKAKNSEESHLNENATEDDTEEDSAWLDEI